MGIPMARNVSRPARALGPGGSRKPHGREHLSSSRPFKSSTTGLRQSIHRLLIVVLILILLLLFFFFSLLFRRRRHLQFILWFLGGSLAR
jgi:hypothetical protein